MNTISFPRMFNKNSYSMTTSLSYEIESINESIKSLLSCNQGELLGDPVYGTTIKKHLFEIKTNANSYLVKNDLAKVISDYIPQIECTYQDINIYSNPNNEKYKITIGYKIRNNGEYCTYTTILSV